MPPAPEVWSAQETWDICERFAKVGKPLHFTEATILSGHPGYELKRNDPHFQWTTTPEGEQRQAEEVVQFYTILFSHPAVQAITWWDFSDQGAWQGRSGRIRPRRHDAETRVRRLDEAHQGQMVDAHGSPRGAPSAPPSFTVSTATIK